MRIDEDEDVTLVVDILKPFEVGCHRAWFIIIGFQFTCGDAQLIEGVSHVYMTYGKLWFSHPGGDTTKMLLKCTPNDVPSEVLAEATPGKEYRE
jgi:hypothetical protein